MGQSQRADSVDWRAEDAIERDPLGALDALDLAWSEYWHAAVAGAMSTDRKRQALHALRDEMGLR